ncbi:hypothetical protein CDD83_4467 [Cordyceps sp. RAO-2017]|nr:hypothetical protein CDD83_4467 [Cordyceps sp. RAO-2017]
MAHHLTGLTGSQNPPRRSSRARSVANDPQPPSDRDSPDGSPGSHPRPGRSPRPRLPRKNSAPGLTDPGSSLPANGRTPPYATSQHARQLSLQHSLAKPLPQTPPHPAAANQPTHPADALHLAVLSDADLRAEHSPSRPTDSAMDGRTSTMDSASSAASAAPFPGGPDQYVQDMSSSLSSIGSSARRDSNADEPRMPLSARSNGTNHSAGPSPAATQSRSHAAAASGLHVGGPSRGSSAHLSGLMCNVHRTTGREPPPLVGATTTILGDKLYVFGGRVLSRSRPAPLTANLYELDLIRRHWSKLDTSGDLPPPRYFHSMCPLGDTKIVCYGGMSPSSNQPTGADQQQQQPQPQPQPQPDQPKQSQPQQPEVTVMSDIYIYDVPTKKWTYVPAQDAPQGRYAHCACVLPSSATFSSARAPLSALQHNPSTGNPGEGQIGINIDGSGGAEMVVVGGQDGGNHYIEQISVFNLRSLKWTSTQPLGKSCGAYRSVTAPLTPSMASRIGRASQQASQRPDAAAAAAGAGPDARDPGSSMLIYSNYNFLDVKLELQIRSSDGSLTERPMSGTYSPPGLRFPNGGVIDTHFVVSGTYLTSSKQEYALWALDLRTLTWSRIDAGGSVFSQGSWNRGVLWNRRNTFVILGNRKRSLRLL